jgi:hypothetical protein
LLPLIISVFTRLLPLSLLFPTSPVVSFVCITSSMLLIGYCTQGLLLVLTPFFPLLLLCI